MHIWLAALCLLQPLLSSPGPPPASTQPSFHLPSSLLEEEVEGEREEGEEGEGEEEAKLSCDSSVH